MNTGMTARYPAPAQSQCPNCGGYKLADEAQAINPKTGLPWVKLGCLWTYGIGMLVFIGILFFGSGVAAIRQPLAPGEPSSIPILVLGVGAVLLTLAGLLVVRVITSGRARKRREVALHRYHCLLCGFAWAWRNDQPYPYRTGAAPFAPNAEQLRRLGEQRLAQEQEELRRRLIIGAGMAEIQRQQQQRQQGKG